MACGGRSSRLDADDSSDAGTGGSAEGGTQDDAGETSTGAVQTGGARASGGGTAVGGETAVGGGAAVGGSTETGGQTPTGGRGGDAPTGGSSVGGAMCGFPTGPMPPPECQGIKSNQPCAFEGQECADLPCGLADTGRRVCACATNWACTSCDFTNSPLRPPPSPLQACPAEVSDGVYCSAEGLICGPIGSEICVCYVGPDGCLIWDCDRPPNCWGSCGF